MYNLIMGKEGGFMFHKIELDFPVDYDQTWRAYVSVGDELQTLLRIEIGSEAEGIWRARIDIRREKDEVVARIYPHNPEDEDHPAEHVIPLLNLLGLT
jgi:hypothetical protein